MLPIGSWLNLITKAEVRYVGRLAEIDLQNASLLLDNVMVYGTEGRVKNKNDEVQPYRNDPNLKVRFDGANLKEVFLLSQAHPILEREQNTVVHDDYRQDLEDIDGRYSDRFEYPRKHKYHNDHIDERMIPSASSYNRQAQSLPQQRPRASSPFQKPVSKQSVDPHGGVPSYDFELSPEMNMRSRNYGNFSYAKKQEPDVYTGRKKQLELQNDEEEEPHMKEETVESSSQIDEAIIIENLRQLYIGSLKKDAVENYEKSSPSSGNLRKSPSQELETENRAEVHHTGNRRFVSRPQNNVSKMQDDRRTYHDAVNTQDHHSQRKPRSTSHPFQYSERYNKDNRYEHIQHTNGPSKNAGKYRQHGKETRRHSNEQASQNLLKPLDTEEIFGQTSNFAMQQKNIIMAETTLHKKKFYVKDSFFDDISCESKDRLTGNSPNYRKNKFQENNLNMQTFGEILNSNARYPKYRYRSDRTNQQKVRSNRATDKVYATHKNNQGRNYAKNHSPLPSKRNGSRDEEET